MARSRAVRSLCTAGLVVALAGYYLLAFGRLTVNATDSLPDHAYAMVTWPRLPWRGAVVAIDLPEVLAEKLEGDRIYLTKRVAGLAGDPVVQRRDDRLCIATRCVEAQRRDGALLLPLWDAAEVPAGSIAVLGDSPDSLDSRYAVIGAIPHTAIRAVGIAIPFPHWTTLAEWLR
ncbi:S26 family signal peptidase [Pukyongiella litopenaei]|uniref:Signal peptidase I n=1 Tax=Pukyongiella litopenaei TaxID=2605946 RepID=A0A5C2H2K9_9RHOB|nr:S26 family signal peptidase [Pukyongiella litopenaei]QEP30430.1 signal peptidase I [Pukyongiella litopenaei]